MPSPPCIDENELMDFLAGEVSEARAAEIHGHVDTCDACRRVLAALADVEQGSVTRTSSPALAAAPAAPMVALGSVLSDRFELEAELGHGGMGVVFAAKDRRLGVTLALKLLAPRYAKDPAAVTLLQNEIVVARRITHRNVCRVYDFGTSESHHYFTMELIKGRSLEAALRHWRSARDAPRIFSEIAAGLAAAHAEGVVHRDLKPANVMLDASGTAKLMDFGLASNASADASGSSSEDDSKSRVAGTPRYWAPEQARGEPPQPAADVYSAGVIGAQLFTGLRVQDARRAEHRATIPRRYRTIIERCLELDPRDRPQGGAELLADIERARRLPQRVLGGVAAFVVVALVGAFVARSVNAGTHSARARAALEAMEEGHTEEAGVELDRLVLADVRTPDALLGSAITKWWREQPYPHVERACDDAIEAHQPPGRELFLKAIKPLALEHWSEALAVLSEPVAGAESEPLVAYGRFEALYHGGRARDATETYEGLLRSSPKFRLGYDHFLDSACATADERALGYANGSWLKDDLLFSHYAVQVSLAKGNVEEAMALAEQSAARSPDSVQNLLYLAELRSKVMLVRGDVGVVQGELDRPQRVPLSPLELLGYAVAMGNGAQVAQLMPRLDAEFGRGLPAASEFRMRLDAWLILRLGGEEGVERYARAALALPVPSRASSLNVAMLETLSADEAALHRLVAHPFPPVAQAAKARLAEQAGRFDEAAGAWGEAAADSLDDRFVHLERLFEAQALVKAGRPVDARAACEFEATPHSLHWSMFPVRAECLLLQASTFIEEGDLGQARTKLERLRAVRSPAAQDAITARQLELEGRATAR